jgi:hypothetical protein
LPAELVQATSILAVNGWSKAQSERTPVAIGIWAAFAHPRQRTGAAMSPHRDGLTAEIALAVQPALIALVGTYSDFQIALLTDDQIVAELAGRAAISIARGESDDEAVGPWEHPLIQHATELRLGVQIPAQIDASHAWVGTDHEETPAAFTRFAQVLAARIGVDLAD